MKVWEKITKAEWCVLALTVFFLAGMAFLYAGMTETAEETGYTVTTQRKTEEPVTPEAKGPVDVNTADLEELQTLQGIGPALAQRIIDHREAHGPYESLEDLLKVKGIGEATLEKFRDHAVAAGPDGENSAEETAG